MLNNLTIVLNTGFLKKKNKNHDYFSSLERLKLNMSQLKISKSTKLKGIYHANSQLKSH